MHNGLFRNGLVFGLVVVALLCIFTMGNVVQGATIYLQDIDSGLTSPTGDYRWLDIADQNYSSTYRTSYNYTQATVTVDYEYSSDSLQGTLIAVNLKPNFAYQLKLVGTPGTAANERIGLAGRWWQEEWIGSWTGGQNLNNKGDGSSPNPNDLDYFQNRDITDSTSPTGLNYKHTGYLVFDYFITDENGNATLDFETNSSYHVLWKTTQSQPYTDDDGPIKSKTFDPDPASPAYDVNFSVNTTEVFGEWERLPVGGIYWYTGDFTQMKLTEESFHGSGGTYAGNWAAAMGADMPFTIPQKWYLSNETSNTPKIMYKGNASKMAGVLTLANGESEVWRADEPSQGVTFPTGNWTVLLMLNSAFSEDDSFNVSVGNWNGTTFTPAGSHQFTGDGTKAPLIAIFQISSFVISTGDYLAVNITKNGASESVGLKAGEDYISCISPESDPSPGYPVPELPSWILVVTGLLFLLFITRRRYKR
jgi:hypothetical protein